MRHYRETTPILDPDLGAGDDYLAELGHRIQSAKHLHARRYAAMDWIN